ncbi:hypothetical protein B0H19DRAFT_999971 [Mycena capillaripes]|nr:hypothetical protein B0H19DRAFT_999971 [Mycena capillaripes]
MFLSCFGLYLLCTLISISAQLASPQWRKPNITTTPTDRVSIAGAGIEKAMSMIQSDGQFAGEAYIVAGIFYSQLADFDIATNQTLYQSVLQRYFVLAQANRANFSDELSYGHAAARAYAAYKDPIFLQYAVEAWWFGRTYTLSQDNVDVGRIPGKNFTIGSQCQDITMTGGTFYTIDSTDPDINGLGSGYFATLSALLAEATPDSLYLKAAEESTEFIHAHLYNIQNLVQDTISSRVNDSCAVGSVIEPYNSGVMIEALAVLASITHNASTQVLLETIVQAAIVNTAWQGSNGIIANPGHGSEGDISLVQGLAAAYSRNVTTPAIRAYIGAYLAVQFNAVLDLATSGDSNIYGLAWIGPPSSIFLGAHQTTALSVLISAISLRNDTEPTGSGTSPAAFPSSEVPSNPPPGEASSRASFLGAVTGGIVGGVILILVGFGFCFIRRRRHRRAERTEVAPSAAIAPSAAVAGSHAHALPEIRPFTGVSRSQPITESSTAAPPQDPQGGNPYSMRQKPPSHSGKGLARTTITVSPEISPGFVSPVALEQRSGASVGPSNSALPTEELIRLLNERLQDQGPWDGEEAPPDYPSQ